MVTRDEVRRVARLARLHIEDDRVDAVTSEFNAIIEYIRALERVNVDDVEPMSHVHGSVNVFREDAVVHTITVEQGLQNAPDRSDTSFRVPLIIGQPE